MEGTEIRPFGQNVLIRPILKDDKVGGIYLPDSKEKPTLKGEVVSIGKDAYTELFVGQIVYYEKYSGNEVREGLILIPCTDLSGGEFSLHEVSKILTGGYTQPKDVVCGDDCSNS
jgi:co-chaperonin GroES (HSP10)